MVVWWLPPWLSVFSARAGANGGDAAPKTVGKGTVAAGSVIAAPQGTPVLVVRGNGLRTNTADGVAVDMAALDALPAVRDGHQLPVGMKRSVVYRGVLMSEFLKAIGTPDTAATVTATALDDYKATLKTVEELRSGTVLLATQADGKVLEVKDGGPTRIVFLPSSKSAKNEELWIWSLKDMTVQLSRASRADAGSSRCSWRWPPESSCCSSG